MIGTFAPPPHGSSRHRARAGSRRLQRDSSRSLAAHRPPISRSTGVPRGLGVLGPPPRCRLGVPPPHRHRVYPCARPRVPPCLRTVCRGVEAPTRRRVSPGCRWGGGRPAQPSAGPCWPTPIRRLGSSHLTTLQPGRRLPLPAPRGPTGVSGGGCGTAWSPRLAACGSVAPAGALPASPHLRGRNATCTVMPCATSR